jgi:hypothetical protein
VTIALVILIVAGLLGLLAFTIVDSVGVSPTKTTVTAIEVKHIVPAYTVIVMAGKVPTSQYHPESYQLHFKIDGEEISSSVKKKFFDDVNVGDKIEVDYGLGRLSKFYQPKRIRLAHN